MKRMKARWQSLWKDEQGIGTLEVILIVAVLVVIAFLFKGWIIGLLDSLFKKIDTKANTILD